MKASRFLKREYHPNQKTSILFGKFQIILNTDNPFESVIKLQIHCLPSFIHPRLLGYGWPRQYGGPMFYADMIGIDKVYERVCHYWSLHRKQHESMNLEHYCHNII